MMACPPLRIHTSYMTDYISFKFQHLLYLCKHSIAVISHTKLAHCMHFFF